MDLFSLVAKLTLDKSEFDKDLDEAEKDLGAVDVPDTKLELDNDDFNQGIEESQGLGDSFGTEMEKVFGNIKTALTVTGIVGAIAGIVNGLKEAVNMTAETADGIDKGSKKLGISTKTYQEWDHALKQSGSSIDVVKKGIMQFQAAIKSADPSTPFADAEDQVDGLADKTAGLSSEAYDALRDLGLLSRLQAGEFQNAEQMMNAALLKLAEFDATDDAQRNERGILTRKLFGKGGDELNAMLDEGVDGVKALLTEASDLGLIMSEDEISNAVKYGDAVENLNAELDAIRQAFVADIIPVLTDAVTWLTDFLTKLNPRTNTQSIDVIFNDIDQKTQRASTKIDEATVTAKKLIEDLQTMGDYWTLDDEGKMTWDALASKALELFPQLSDYIDKDGKKISGNTQEIEKNIDAWARLEKQRLLTSAMEEKSAVVAKKLTDAYEKGAEAALKQDEAEGKRATAMSKLNALLTGQTTNQNVLQFRKQFGERFGTLTDDNFADASAWFKQNYSVLDYGTRDAINEWQTMTNEASNLRKEADEQIKKAEEANSKLKEYEAKLAEQMGLTTSDIQKADQAAEEYKATLESIPNKVVTKFVQEDERGFPHAIGSAYVPYDNYPALLHRGEKVLTATEARRSEGSNVDLSGLEDRLAAAIRAGMDGVSVNSYINGRAVTEEVNRENMKGIKGRRFSG